MSLHIVSINVNGIRDSEKRKVIFHWLKIQNFDICLLQETHCGTKDEVNYWSKEWKGKSLWSNGTSSSRGVACLFKHNLDLDICHSERDPNGRFVSADVKIDDHFY